jgi:heterodisulfide reductase subunit C
MKSNIEKCYQCGQCTAACPMSEQEQAYKIRRFLQMEKLGLPCEEPMMIPFIFYCTTCYKCQDNCPQNVKIVDGLLDIREKAIRNGDILPAHKKIGQMLLNSGHAVPGNDKTEEKRIKLGLEAIPPTVSNSEKHLNDFKLLLSLSGFNKIVAEESL